MKRYFANIAKQRQQAAENPSVERRMRMSLHGDPITQQEKSCVVWMGRVNLRVLRSGQVVDVVALDRVVQEGDAQQNDEGKNGPQSAAHNS